jgi:methylthioribose-1-phosphate isomerase
MASTFETVTWTDRGTVRLIDQTRLPTEEVYVECRDFSAVFHAIREMQVRGAPAIGVTAAMGMALGALASTAADPASLLADLERLGDEMNTARPTAVNLAWAVRRILRHARKHRDLAVPAIQEAIVREARAMKEEDVAINRAIGRHGQAFLADGCRVLTHCNAGALATAGYGTALGVIRAAVEAGKRLTVWVDETRPFLQGARLTAWELHRDGIPVTLITDNMAGHFMQRGQVDAVVVGADRVAANGDTANKIGTYPLSVLARVHGIPFYVAAPLSTVDLTLADGSGIPIEERPPREVTHMAGRALAPADIGVANPAFDVTPAANITAIITERGVARAPYAESLRALAEAAGIER